MTRTSHSASPNPTAAPAEPRGGRLLRLLRRRGLVPTMSDTERAALEAGTVWVDGELFSGAPDWGRLLTETWSELTAEERAFLDGPVEQACALVDPWQLAASRELPPAVWALLREHRFFGLGLPQEWGGHGFSALAQSTIFARLASHSLALSAIVLIPNSVGPGELLLAHGTAGQRSHYLPRLARGEEIPCFALTEPEAGSDAASIRSSGVVERGADGRPWLRLDFEKRYITLAPIATLIGLAFRLRDPLELLGRGKEPGITVALVPATTPGVEIGRWHDPMGVPFPNGPIAGRGVRLPATAIIGGAAGAGQGWRMLMEALSAGRAISLPAQSAGGIALAARMAGAYARIREQFALPIARFEGIIEPLARLAGLAYLVDAGRRYTCSAVDSGQRPAVVSALMKYRTTELCRAAVADAMDVMAGAALCRGPGNRLADGWASTPIGITVEGANILTRTLIVFGQGVVRSHPWVRRVLAALEGDSDRALLAALGGHLGFIARNLLRVVALEATRGLPVGLPASTRAVPAPARRELRHAIATLRRGAARFALAADLALFLLGPGLKRRGALAGRLADALSALYLGTAAARRFLAEGGRAEDRRLLRWAIDWSAREVDGALAGLAANLPRGLLASPLRALLAGGQRLAPLGRPTNDRLAAVVAATLTEPGPQRDRLTDHLHLPADPTSAVGRLEHALSLIAASEPLRARLRRARREHDGFTGTDLAAAVIAGVLTAEEAEILAQAETARSLALAVDSFPPRSGPRIPPAAAPAEGRGATV